MSAFKTIAVQLRTNVASFRAEMGAAGQAVANFGRATAEASVQHRELGRNVGIAATAIGGTLAGALVVAGRQAVEFDAAMHNVNSISGMSAQQLGKLSDQVLDLSRKLPQSATTLAQGLYDVASSGFQGAQGVQVLTASAQAASAGLSTTATAAKAITAVLNAYGEGASSAKDVSDILFQTVNLGVVNFDELASSIGDVVGIASQAGVSFDQVGSAIAAMTLSGLQGNEAATSLNRLVQGLLEPNKSLATVYEQLGIESGVAALKADGLRGVMTKLQTATGGNVNAVLSLFNDIRAARGAMALMSAEGANYARVAGAIEDPTTRAGAAQRALAEQSKSASFQIQVAKNAVSALAIEMTRSALPALRSGADFAQAVANGFASMPGPLKGAATAATALFSAVSLLGGGFLLLLPRLQAMRVALVEMQAAGSPIPAVLGAIAPVAVGAVAGLALLAAGYAGVAVASANAERHAQELVARLKDGADESTIAGLSAVAGKLQDQELALVNARDNTKGWIGSLKELGQDLLPFVGNSITDNQHKIGALGKAVDDESAKWENAFQNTTSLMKTTGLSFDDVGKLAKQMGVDLTKAFTDSGGDRQKLIDNVTALGKIVAPTGTNIAKAAAVDIEQLQAEAKAITDLQDKAVSALNADTNALGNFDPKKTGLAQFYKNSVHDAQTFVNQIADVAKRGLNPKIIVDLLTAGPTQAAPILTALVADHSNKLIGLANSTAASLSTIDTKVAEFSRLTQSAISAPTDALTRDLGSALKIVNINLDDANAGVAGVAKSLGISADDVRRIADEFGISIKGLRDAAPAIGPAVVAAVSPAIAALAALGQGAQDAYAKLQQLGNPALLAQANAALGVTKSPGPSASGSNAVAQLITGQPHPDTTTRGPTRQRAMGGVDPHVVTSESVLYGERQTGGEAFVPRLGDPSRAADTLATAASWYGMQVVPMAGGGVLGQLGGVFGRGSHVLARGVGTALKYSPAGVAVRRLDKRLDKRWRSASQKTLAREGYRTVTLTDMGGKPFQALERGGVYYEMPQGYRDVPSLPNPRTDTSLSTYNPANPSRKTTGAFDHPRGADWKTYFGLAQARGGVIGAPTRRYAPARTYAPYRPPMPVHMADGGIRPAGAGMAGWPTVVVQAGGDGAAVRSLAQRLDALADAVRAARPITVHSTPGADPLHTARAVTWALDN